MRTHYTPFNTVSAQSVYSATSQLNLNLYFSMYYISLHSLNMLLWKRKHFTRLSMQLLPIALPWMLNSPEQLSILIPILCDSFARPSRRLLRKCSFLQTFDRYLTIAWHQILLLFFISKYPITSC